MDMNFLRRAERMLAHRQPMRLEFGILVATLAAQRVATAAEREPELCLDRQEGDDEPLIELLLAGPGWRKALSAQGGCFSRAEAGRRVNAP